jgi:hypothetical protein
MCGWLQIDSEENEGMNFENDRPAPVPASSKLSSVFCLLSSRRTDRLGMNRIEVNRKVGSHPGA